MSLAPGRFHRRRCAAALVASGALLLTACGPDPTPLPVVPVATAPAAEQTAPPAADVLLIDPLTLGMLTAEARAQLESAAELRAVETFPSDYPGAALSVLPFAGAEVAEYTLPVVARLNVELAPLDDPALAQALRDWLTSVGRGQLDDLALRLALANAGYPDGLVMRAVANPAVMAAALPLLNTGPLRWLAEPGAEDAHLEIGAGAESVALLEAGGGLFGTLPLYLTPGWRLTADSAGLPVLERSAGG